MQSVPKMFIYRGQRGRDDSRRPTVSLLICAAIYRPVCTRR